MYIHYQGDINVYWERETVFGRARTPFSVLEFWQWALSALTLNMNRGTLAEFIVKSAMEYKGFDPDVEEKTGIESFDLTGPDIPSLRRPSRIEVKSAAFIQQWRSEPSNKAVFSIAPHIMQTETGDYKKLSMSRRNNDLYVFCLWKAQSLETEILNLDWWDFFVYPTFMINENPHLQGQKTISLPRLIKLGIQPQSFETLYDEINQVISCISDHYIKTTVSIMNLWKND